MPKCDGCKKSLLMIEFDADSTGQLKSTQEDRCKPIRKSAFRLRDTSIVKLSVLDVQVTRVLVDYFRRICIDFLQFLHRRVSE